jgi:hypothetical protein
VKRLSPGCQGCGGRVLHEFPGGFLVCPVCDTAPDKLNPSSFIRGCPPNMPGSEDGYTVVKPPTTMTEE